MRAFLILCSLILLISCKKEIKKNEKQIFLIGDWIRTNDKIGSKTYENWNKDLIGFGYTIKDKDTTFKEYMSIIKKNDTLFLKVDSVNEKSTYFKFTQQTDSSFICENPKNEFPKKIIYWLENNQLKATVSSDEFSIDFIFERLK